MRLRSADVVTYGGAVEGARGAVERWSERRGVLVRLVDGEGRVAQGEASPLPRYSVESFDAVRDALVRLDWAALPEVEPGEAPLAFLTRLAPGLAALPAAARFAVETALLDRVGQDRNLPIWALLGGSSEPGPVALSFLAGGADDPATVTRAARAREQGFSNIKVKVAGPSLGEQITTLERIRAAIGDGALRLDANGSLDDRTALGELGRLAGMGPEFIEEPVPPEALPGLGAPPIPLALDESLVAPGAFARLAPHLGRLRCVALVLKPMLLGGFSACVALTKQARAAGLDVTVSHLFDGPVALAASAHLALAVGSRSRGSGLAAHAGLGAWPSVSIAMLGAARIVPGAAPGLGLAPLPGPT